MLLRIVRIPMRLNKGFTPIVCLQYGREGRQQEEWVFTFVLFVFKFDRQLRITFLSLIFSFPFCCSFCCGAWLGCCYCSKLHILSSSFFVVVISFVIVELVAFLFCKRKQFVLLFIQLITKIFCGMACQARRHRDKKKVCSPLIKRCIVSTVLKTQCAIALSLRGESQYVRRHWKKNLESNSKVT